MHAPSISALKLVAPNCNLGFKVFAGLWAIRARSRCLDNAFLWANKLGCALTKLLGSPPGIW